MFKTFLGEPFEKLSAKEKERRSILLGRIIHAHLFIMAAFAPLIIGIYVIEGQRDPALIVVPLTIMLLIIVCNTLFANTALIKTAILLEIVPTLAFTAYLSLVIKADGLHNLLYLWLVLLCALILDGFFTLGLGLIILALMGTTILMQTVLKIWMPLVKLSTDQLSNLQLLFGLGAAVLIIVTAILIAGNLTNTMRRAELEAANLAHANYEISQREQASRECGEQVNQLAKELAGTSQQQASGAHEQVASVIEVTSSMEELSETARQIATNATAVAHAATEALNVVNHMQQASQQTGETSERGQLAVESAIIAIEVVRNRIEILGQRLLNLTARSRQINAIIDLITEIADETHLLALNAAIESAGVGQNGRRFGVIAQEVQNLADRSLEAAQEVRRAIIEVQGAVAAAVLAAEEGKKETGGAVERSYQAGMVISELSQVVHQSSEETRQILQAVEAVAALTEEISLATRHQQSASDQIVSTLRVIAEVAQQNANASATTTQTVKELQSVSSQLQMKDKE